MSEPDNIPDDVPASAARPVWPLAVLVFAITVAVGLLVTAGGGKPASMADEAVAASDGSPSALDGGEQVRIPTLGLSVVRPQGWVTITAEENAQNIRSVQMDDPEFQAMAARYANSPIFAISKYQEPYRDLNPSFKINVRPLGGFAKFSPEDILTAAIPAMSRVSSDMQVLEGPRATQVSGRKAAYAKLSYTLKARNVAVPTISEIWIVPKGAVFFMIGAGTRADEKNGTRAEMRQILDGVRIE